MERPLLARFGRTVVPTMPVSGEVVRCISPPHPPGKRFALNFGSGDRVCQHGVKENYCSDFESEARDLLERVTRRRSTSKPYFVSFDNLFGESAFQKPELRQINISSRMMSLDPALSMTPSTDKMTCFRHFVERKGLKITSYLNQRPSSHRIIPVQENSVLHSLRQTLS